MKHLWRAILFAAAAILEVAFIYFSTPQRHWLSFAQALTGLAFTVLFGLMAVVVMNPMLESIFIGDQHEEKEKQEPEITIRVLGISDYFDDNDKWYEFEKTWRNDDDTYCVLCGELMDDDGHGVGICYDPDSDK